MISNLFSLTGILLAIPSAWLLDSDNKQIFVVPANEPSSVLHDLNDRLSKVEMHLEKKNHNMKKELEKLKKEIINVVHNPDTLPNDCKEILRKGYNDSGIYRIQPILSPVDVFVWCDMSTLGGGWTYLLNRFDGSQDFSLNWTEYRNGFGRVSDEHWLGLEHMYYLTSSRSNEVLIEVVDWDNLKKFDIVCDDFKIYNESTNYKMRSFGKCTSKNYYRQSFGVDTDIEFITDSPDICGTNIDGGWWYNSFNRCQEDYMTGTYNQTVISTNGLRHEVGIQWRDGSSSKEVRMMIRPKSNY